MSSMLDTYGRKGDNTGNFGASATCKEELCTWQEKERVWLTGIDPDKPYSSNGPSGFPWHS